MSTNAKRAGRIPKPAPQGKTQAKQRIERDAFYGVAELRALTGYGRNTIYAILSQARNHYADGGRHYRVTGAEFLALRAAYFGYTDVA